MLAYAFLMTLLVGITFGVIVTVSIALYMEKREKETERRKKIHPSGHADLSVPNILDYSK